MQVLSPSVPMGCLSPCPSRTEQRLSWLLPDVLLVLPGVREVQRARRGWQRAAPAGWPWGTLCWGSHRIGQQGTGCLALSWPGSPNLEPSCAPQPLGHPPAHGLLNFSVLSVPRPRAILLPCSVPNCSSPP